MVSIVIVSHSRRLAEGIVELTEQITHGQVAMAMAAGMDDPEFPIGTDPLSVQQAIEQVFCPDGVLVLVDMGSALLSADMALEFLAPEQADRVQICAAPLVEGAIAAAVSAAAGMPLDAVAREAHGALAAKYQAIEQPPIATPAQLDANNESPPAESLFSSGEDTTLTFSWTIRNRGGLHIRPAAILAAALGRFEAKIWLSKTGKQVNAKSINNIMRLGVQSGDTLTFTASGHDAEKVITTLKTLAESNLEQAPN